MALEICPFEAVNISLEQKRESKRVFLEQFDHFNENEREELSRFYDLIEDAHEFSEPREGLPGKPRERYFAHVKRVVLMAIVEFKIRLGLIEALGFFTHDAQEETKKTIDDLIALGLPQRSAEIAKVLTIPGKRPGVEITQAMRKIYYENVRRGDVICKLGFNLDHLDAARTAECLSLERQKRKFQEVDDFCIPWTLEYIAPVYSGAANMIIAEFELARCMLAKAQPC